MVYFMVIPLSKECIPLSNERNVLYSFAYWNKAESLPGRKKKIIDSGAYSIWNTSLDLRINDYIDFLNKFKGQYDYAINFDEIYDAKKSYKNQKYIESRGAKVIPVFHIGSKYKYLQQLIDEGYKYIALGGAAVVKRSGQQEAIDDFYSKCFSLGKPHRIKFHGLGMGIDICAKFPLYSIDTTNIMNSVRYGKFYIKEKVHRMNRRAKNGDERFKILKAHGEYLDSHYKQVVKENIIKYWNYFKDKKTIQEILS